MARAWGPWLILLLLPLAVHLPLAFGLSADPLYFYSHLTLEPPHGPLPGVPGISDPNSGWTTQALGGLAARQWLNGELPWWNPYSGVGLPLAAEGQNAALFLPFVLLLAAPEGVALMRMALQMAAGMASYALLRRLGLGQWAALLGGIFYELNGTFASTGGAAIMPVPFLPLLLLGLEQARARALARQAGGWGWISVALAYSLYAGFPETAYIDGLLALLWAGFRCVQGAGARFAGKVAAGGTCGLLLAAPLLVAFLPFLIHGDVGIHGAVEGHTGVEALGLYPGTYAKFLSPYLFGTVGFAGQWLEWDAAGGFLDLSLLLLALLALRRAGLEAGLRWMLAAWIVLALAKSAQVPGVAQAFDLIPGLRQTYFRRYAPPSWEMAAMILAAFALDDWRRGPGLHRRLPLAVAACVAALAASLVAAWPEMVEMRQAAADYPVYAGASLGWICLIFTATATLLAAGPRRRTALGLVLAGNAAVLAAVPMLSATPPVKLDTEAIAFLQKNLGLERFYALGGAFPPNYSAWFGLAAINDIYLPAPRIWVDYVHAHLDPGADSILFDGDFSPFPGESRAEALMHRLPAYAALGVRFVVAPHGKNPLPGTPAYSDALLDITELPSPAPYFEARGGDCTLIPAGRLVVRASCAAPATLVRREMADSGWRATVNGAEQAVGGTDDIFQSVVLPAGVSEVRFAYAPPGMRWAGAAFLLGLAGWLRGVVVRRRA